MLIDSRAGSGHLVSPLRGQGIPAHRARLDVADAAFVGMGARGPILVGVEIKSVTDLIDSIHTGRFVSNQLPGLVGLYDEAWLAVHGRTRSDTQGYLEFWHPVRGRWLAADHGRAWKTHDVEAWLLTIEVKAGIRIKRVDDEDGLVQWLATLFRWWGKPFDRHHAARALYQDRPADGSLIEAVWSGRQDPATLLRRLAKELPGTGWQRSLAIDKRFGGSIEQFCQALADPVLDDWTAVEGIGKTIASRICDSLRDPPPDDEGVEPFCGEGGRHVDDGSDGDRAPGPGGGAPPARPGAEGQSGRHSGQRPSVG